METLTFDQWTPIHMYIVLDLLSRSSDWQGLLSQVLIQRFKHLQSNIFSARTYYPTLLCQPFLAASRTLSDRPRARLSKIGRKLRLYLLRQHSTARPQEGSEDTHHDGVGQPEQSLSCTSGSSCRFERISFRLR